MERKIVVPGTSKSNKPFQCKSLCYSELSQVERRNDFFCKKVHIELQTMHALKITGIILVVCLCVMGKVVVPFVPVVPPAPKHSKIRDTAGTTLYIYSFH